VEENEGKRAYEIKIVSTVKYEEYFEKFVKFRSG